MGNLFSQPEERMILESSESFRTVKELRKMKRKAIDQRLKEQIEMGRQKARKLEVSTPAKQVI